MYAWFFSGKSKIIKTIGPKGEVRPSLSIVAMGYRCQEEKRVRIGDARVWQTKRAVLTWALYSSIVCFGERWWISEATFALISFPLTWVRQAILQACQGDNGHLVKLGAVLLCLRSPRFSPSWSAETILFEWMCYLFSCWREGFPSLDASDWLQGDDIRTESFFGVRHILPRFIRVL